MTPRVPWWHSLRLRITLSIALMSVLAIGIVATVVSTQSSADARERLRAQAYERLDAAEVFFNVYGRNRQGSSLDDEEAPKELLEVITATSEASYFDGVEMWAGRRLAHGPALIVRVDGRDLNARRDGLNASLLGTGTASVLATSVLGWFVATGLSRRLRRGAEAAQDITAGHPERRASQPGSDEVAALTAAVDDMAEALTTRLAREREFSADVAHELRTPVTALVSAAELLGPDEASALVRSQVRRLRVLVEQLLEVARLDSTEAVFAPERVDLAQAVAASLDRTGGEPTAVRVEASRPVLLEPARLDRVLTNLVTNSFRHGATSCTVVVDDVRLRVVDDGPGYPDELLAKGPRRFARPGDGSGSGLGLVIASRQAAAMGAELCLANTEFGAQAELTFATPCKDPRALAADEVSGPRRRGRPSACPTDPSP